MFKTQRFQAVEIPIPSGSTATKFYFPDLPQLTGRNGYPVKIQSIVFYTDNLLTQSPLTGSDVVTDSDVQKSYLTLYQGDLQTIYNIPCIQLNMIAHLGAGNIYQFQQPLFDDLINISWTKSFVSLPTAAATTNVVYAIGVHYSVEY
jgi:hypothetical protein